MHVGLKIMQDGMVVQDFKSTVDFTVRDIFLDNHNWDVFRFQHRAVIRQVEVDFYTWDYDDQEYEWFDTAVIVIPADDSETTDPDDADLFWHGGFG